MVQGNPARPVAKCGIPLSRGTTPKEFYQKLRPRAADKKLGAAGLGANIVEQSANPVAVAHRFPFRE